MFSSAPSIVFNPADPRSYRLYLVTDDAYLDKELNAKIINACRGGVSIVQLRFKSQNTDTYVKAATELKARLKDLEQELSEAGVGAAGERLSSKIPLIIDDRLDVCMAADCDGLHVGNGDLDPVVARRLLGNDKILGVSTYGEKDRMMYARDEAKADYVAGGGVFSSSTKTYKLKGPGALTAFKTQCCALGYDYPLVAIGGIELDTTFETARAGADGIAAVRALLGEDVNDVQGKAEQMLAEVIRAETEKRNEQGAGP